MRGKSDSRRKLSEHGLAVLDEEGLDELERHLVIASSKLVPGEERSFNFFGKHVREVTPSRDDIEDIEADIIRTSKCGVRIAPYPESVPLIPLFELEKIELPAIVRIQHEKMRYDYYFVQANFSMMLSNDEFPLFTSFDINLNDDVRDPVRKARPVALFPARKDIKLFKIDLEAAIGIDAGMGISVPRFGSDIMPYARLSAEAKAKAGLITKPYSFTIRRAAIEVTGEGDNRIAWRYNLESELSGANEFKSFLILKVPQEAQSVTLQTALKIIPCKHRWLVLRDQLPALSYNTVLPVELVMKEVDT